MTIWSLARQLCLVLFFWAFANISVAQEIDKPVTFNLKATEILPFVEKMILSGQLAEARNILQQIRGKTPDPLQEMFFLAQIAGLEKKYDEAIKLYRQILAQNPGLTRVRLDLARTLFLAKKDGKAKLHFELVLAGELPEKAKEKVETFLHLIRKRKRWQLRSFFALAPDSNISAGPDQDEVESRFGSGGILSQDAQETSGFGLLASLGANYFWPLDKNKRLKAGANIYRAQYGKSQFNDTYLTANLGPHFVFQKNTYTLQATGSYRWYGERRYNYSYGLEISSDHILSRRWRLENSLYWREQRYILDKAREGHVAGGAMRFNYGLNSSSFAQIIAGYSQEKARAESNSFSAYQMGLGYYKDWGRGMTLYIKPSLSMRNYAAADNFFAIKREDRRASFLVEMRKSDWALWGFAPLFSYQYTHNQSNIDFFTYERHRFQMGLSRVF